MSKIIDEQVVSMKFDNKHFMDNTADTISRLDKLKASLHLPGAAKGLEDVGAAANGIKLNPLSSAAEQVSLKFNAMASFADAAIRRIANTAMAYGEKIVTSLTIDPIKTGLQEYETQINAVQTILANTESKGTTLNDVNGALDKLNTYADKTIYNFTEMTRNIGTFTAAGVDLDTSVNAIQGIANLAAVSGSNSQQASTAMYQLSQALSSGTVKLMDWNSVVNAGMGGQVFQDALKETARVHDIAIDDMIEEQGSFRETLSEGWLTSEILTETLQKFTMATEGLTEEQIAQNRAMLKSKGYTDEQIDGIFKLGNTATNAATKVKTFTQLMDTLKESAQSGWTQTWEILVGDFEEAKKLWTSVSEVFGKIIGDSAEARNTLLQGWADGGGRDDMLQSFVNIYEAIKSIVVPIKEAFRDIFPPATADQLIKITEAIKNFTSKLILSEKAQEKLKSTFKGLFAVIDIVVTAVSALVRGAAKLLNVVFDLIPGLFGVTGSLGDWITKLRDTIKETGIFDTIVNGLVNGLKAMGRGIRTVITAIGKKFKAPGFDDFSEGMSGTWKILSNIAKSIINVFATLGKGLLNAFRNGDIKAAVDLFNTGIIGLILLNIKKFTGSIAKSVGNAAGLIDNVSEILTSVKGCFEAYQKDIQARALQKIAVAIAILAASILVIASIDPDRLLTSIGAISLLFAELLGTMTLFTKINGKTTDIFEAALAMSAMAVAVLILASALKKISGIDPKDMLVGIAGVAALAAIAVLISRLMSTKASSAISNAVQLTVMATSILILAQAVKTLSDISWQDLLKGIGSVVVLLATLTAAAVVMSKMGAAGSGEILVLAIAVAALALAIRLLTDIDFKDILKGAGSLLVVLVALIAAAALMNSFIAGAAGVAALAASFLAMSVALIIGASAMHIIIAALEKIPPIIEELNNVGILGICGPLIALAGALLTLGLVSVFAPLILILSIALTILVPALVALGQVDMESVKNNMFILSEALKSILLVSLASPLIFLLGVALVALGAGALLVGTGLLAASMALTAFATAMATSGNIIIEGVKQLLTTLIGLIPSLVKAVADGIVLLCKTLIDSVDVLLELVAVIIIALCDALIAAVPKLIELVGVLLDHLLKFIVDYVPKIVVAALELIVGLLDGLTQGLPKIIAKAVELTLAFLDGMIGQIPVLIEGAFTIVLNFINGLGAAIETYTPQIMGACANLGVSIVKGVVNGLTSVPGIIWEGVKSVGETVLNNFKEFLGINSPAKSMIPIGQGLDEGIVVGLEEYKGSVVSASEDVGSAAVESMSNAISNITDVIDSDIDSQPVIRPVLDLSDIETGAKSIDGLFGMSPSVGVLSNVGAINSMMNNQNGDNFDIVSAIKDLGAKIGDMSNTTYNINGITYDDGSNIASAIGDLVRAAKIERRI